MRKIQLTNGGTRTVDDDSPALTYNGWYEHPNGMAYGYIGRSRKGSPVAMHRFVAGCTFHDGIRVTFKDGDHTNVTRANLQRSDDDA